MKMTTSGTEINKNHRGASVNKTAEMTKMALMVAMNCVSAYIIIPLPFSLSPLALQTLIVNLTGYVLNAKQAFMTMLVYLLVGLAGVPVFTGGSAGPGKLFGPTGGYIIGFLFTAVFLAYFRGEKYSFKRYALLGCVIGIPLIYVFGVVQLKLITGMGWDKAIMTGALPFIPLDIVKCLAAAVIAGPINRIFANNR
ncbi:MAG: biotin transporter BioY [Phascolarctobacterium succinatutens]|jgi:biotin transport system substrate-specific component|uniref:Biotin transporter n=2 Tax=Phascolarctobacterium succinatutens TaxID=626940 RepID=E8LG53_9FIRM|nr:biotin transporter BioY [Phascolarctobacterium succinatutens]EFY04172.1 BioY family protein [Phascolarctobacterium succinatutens YIT 12067]MEE0357753.1 biotin transporter BioY [Phascolarctobacterium succinatutens]